jgi:uncharacterized protein DUF4184
MPMTFPAHQGLILPVLGRWPDSFDALALSVGAAMPDVTDTVLGFQINGYFKQWYGHSIIGIFTLDLFGGLLIIWFLALVVRRLLEFKELSPRLQALLIKALPNDHPAGAGGSRIRAELSVWSFSMVVGILSHIGFDLISHDTNLLFYPWYEDIRWFPGWWYKPWFEIHPSLMFGQSYSVGVFSVIWCILTLLGIFLFIRFFRLKYENRI